MQKDFHYYCIGILARAAGFNSHDALSIAYASQYVDDATESKQIPINLNGFVLHFDPVLTSYQKLDMLKAIDWSAQKRVWIPFHFIPAMPFIPGDHQPFLFVTRPGSYFARLLLEQAAAEPLINHKRRLCRIGIALHTYADSWAHQDFSGRKSTGENNVEGIWLYHRSSQKWEHLTLENLVLDILPKMGHAQAGFFPDMAFQTWKFTLMPAGNEIIRNNSEIFLDAALNIYTQLKEIEKENGVPPIPWEDIGPMIQELLMNPGLPPKILDKLVQSYDRAVQADAVEGRCELWRRAFSHHFDAFSDQYAYDPQAWRRDALEGDVDWDNYASKDWEQMAPRDIRTGFLGFVLGSFPPGRSTPTSLRPGKYALKDPRTHLQERFFKVWKSDSPL